MALGFSEQRVSKDQHDRLCRRAGFSKQASGG
jgi:hypothetical protein